jgi:catechol 2,3-dioxygenase-like lactoylglutathione lyase family enzyme
MSRLHHVALGARDVASTALFYRDVLGLPELSRKHDASGALRAVWLDADGTVLMIEKTAEPEHRVEGIGAGPFLLAFAVLPEERGEIERALEAAGSPIEARTEHTSYARDPEGNRLAVSHYPRPSRED